MSGQPTLGDLIARLQDIVDSGVSESAPIRIAHQPNYPLAVLLAHLSIEHRVDRVTGARSDVVWLATGAHPSGESPYAPSAAFDEDEFGADDDAERQ